MVPKTDKLHPLLYLILNTLATSLANTCTTDVIAEDEPGDYIRTITYVNCNPVFEVCCNEGCCARFSHAHIWMFAAAISFIMFFCLFGCWLFYCKEKLRSLRTVARPSRNVDDRVDSPLNLVIPEVRNGSGGAQRSENQNGGQIPITPPPTYEEATAMR